MRDSLLHYHNIFSFLVPLTIFICMVTAFYNWRTGNEYRLIHNIMCRVNIGVAHAQMLIGIILYTHRAESVQMQTITYWNVPHATVMSLAIVFVTLALIRVRIKPSDFEKHRLTFVYNALALFSIAIGFMMMPS